MGGKGASGAEQATQNTITQGDLALEQQQNQRSQQLYNLTYPGIQSAESFYQQLSTGNPQAIQTATAPATEQIAKNYQQASQNISQTMPRGGARDLALQQAQISEAGQIGSTEANAYLGSFPALANLAQGGIGLSLGEVTSALSAFGGASSSNQASAQMNSAGKAQTLGFIGALGGDAAQGIGSYYGAQNCWVAEELFGPLNLRTARLRAWLNGVYSKTWTGRMFMWCYRRWGKFVADQARQRSWVRRILMPLFRKLDRMAQEWEQSWADFFRRQGAL